LAHLSGPAARCKPKSDDLEKLVLRFCIWPIDGAFEAHAHTQPLARRFRVLLQVGVPPPAQRYGAVFIKPVDAARGMSFEAVFIPGLAERLFPRKIVEEAILLDRLRQELSAGLKTNDQRVSDERLALGIGVGAADRRLFLSYPRLDLQQGRRVPSFYALEAVRAAEGRLPNFAELDRRAEAESAARIGWPAPDDPAKAIDHAEYDLAVLARFLHCP